MNDFGLKEEDLHMIQGVLRIFPQVQEGLIFGSRAMGNFKKTSDIDIALKGDIDSQTLSSIKSILNDGLPLPYFFDVLDYQKINNPELKKHIDEQGKIFYRLEKAAHSSSI